ncbi:MAG: formate dehydrogenase subunit delta [Rhizomicrobium sp.]|jgi:formate dehydrogenase subunit delta
MSTDDKLIYMANQIAGFFAAQGEARAVPAIADHIVKFWSPDMRARLLMLDRQADAGSSELVRKALPAIEASLAKQPVT